jgi:NAD(P)H dehydrogenase (quinone)
MYAVTGITGKVGGIVARTLLADGLPVRAVVRDANKGRPWAEKGCKVAIASIANADALTKAFSGVDGVFLMTPPVSTPSPAFRKRMQQSRRSKPPLSPRGLGRWSSCLPSVLTWGDSIC